MADGWSISSCIGTCIGAFFTLASLCLSFLPHSLTTPLARGMQRMKDIHDTLLRIEGLLTELLAVAKERPPAPEDQREWEITVTGRAHPKPRHEVASASSQR